MTRASRDFPKHPVRTDARTGDLAYDASAPPSRYPACCYWCGLEMNTLPGHPLRRTREHIIPVILGGSDQPSNIAYAHAFCNTYHDNRTDFIAYELHLQKGWLMRFNEAGNVATVLDVDSAFMHYVYRVGEQRQRWPGRGRNPRS